MPGEGVRRNRRRPQLHAVLGDWHIPFHDPRAVSVALTAVETLRPKVVHVLGDFVDFYGVSDHLRDPQRALSLQDELDEASEMLARLRRTAPPGASIFFHEGNHETRLRRYLNRSAPELAGLRSLRLEELLSFRKHRISFVQYGRKMKVGSIWLTHGMLCRSHSAYTAKGMLEKTGDSVLQGHTHRLGAFHVRRWDGQRAAWENGCLCRLDLHEGNHYTKGVINWQQGFSMIWVQGGWTSVDQHQIDDGRVCINGRIFTN